MLTFEPWKKALIAVILLFGFVSLLPNFFYEDVQRSNDARRLIAQAELIGREPPAEAVRDAALWPSWLPNGLVNLGLDLQGGSYFLLEVQADDVIGQRMRALRNAVGTTLRENGVNRYSDISAGADFVRVRITNADDLDRAEEALGGLAEPIQNVLLGTLQNDIEVVAENDQFFRLVMTDEARDQILETIVNAAIEVLRTRVDALGTREPTILREGTNRILLQLPGVSDVDIEEITQQARLEFRMVLPNTNPSSPPANGAVFQFDPELNPELAGESIVVERQVRLTGDNLADAQQGFNQEGQVGVNIRFDPTGARVFGELSRQVGQRFAMILDGQVLSAPVFEQYIPDGAAIITGEFNIASARALAVNLASGSLPAAVTVEESSEVGPELGADSIFAGQIAALIGFALVLVYMAVSYGLFGVLANVALILNVMLIFGALSLFGATLTLPGIAGIVLTIGMAVDANVLVFERIREELRRGRGVVRAIDTGYSQALTAIIDANVTTFIVAMILFAIGAGPIRGFSVTLGIGIVTSVFTAVMLTRFFVATWYDIKRPKELAL